MKSAPNSTRKLFAVRQNLSTVLITGLLLLLCACTGYNPNDRMLGNSREQVIRTMGQPSTELTRPESKVMIYARGPFGKHTYFVYLDRDDNMARWTQVLDEKNFSRIMPGMTQDEIIAILGPSKDTFGLARHRGYVWNYRYVNPHCFWFQIEFTNENTVRSTGYGKPPECRIHPSL